MSNDFPPPPAQGYGAPMGGTPAGPPPPNNLVLAILSVFCCWPLAIPAIIFAAQVNGKWNAGDAAGAMEASAKAKKFAMIGIIVGAVLTVLYIIAIVALGVGTEATV